METSPKKNMLEVECSNLNQAKITSLKLTFSPELKAQVILKSYGASHNVPEKDKTKIICDYSLHGHYCNRINGQCKYAELRLKDFE